MKQTISFIIKRIKEGRLKEFYQQTIWIYAYVRRYWKSIVLYTLMGLGSTAVSLTGSLLSKDLVDIITGHKASALIQTFVLYVSFSVGNIFMTQLLNYVSSMISLKVDNDMKADIFEKMLETQLEPLTAYHTGDLLTRWSSDASTISNGVLNWIPNLIIYTTRFISALAVVLYYDTAFALLAMMGIPVSVLMSKSLLSKMQANNRQSAAMNAKMSGFNQETFSNIQTIKAFDLIPLYAKKLRTLQKDYYIMKKGFQRLSVFTSITMSLVGVLISYSCYALGIYKVWTGDISYGTMTLFLSLSSSLTSTLNTLINMVPTAVSITTAAGRLMDILNMPREDYSQRGKIAQFYKRNAQHGLCIEALDISYTYHNGKNVFEHASVSAAPHQIAALVGPSGEGKTTMLRILLSLIEPQSGTMHICAANDPADAIGFCPSARQLFSYVPQGNTMFSGTIAENMRNVKPDATDAEIVEVLKTACAWNFVSALPDGINSMIGERGSGLSEGQAQRLSIARALLRKSPILLLDEATSALDVATERSILKNIMADDYPRTCIVTTHRPTVLNICSKVYAIQNKTCRLLSADEIQQIISHF